MNKEAVLAQSEDASCNVRYLFSDMGATPSTWSVICIFHLFTLKASEGFYTPKGDIIFTPSSVVPKGTNVSVICLVKTDPCSGTGRFVFDVGGSYRKPDWMNQTFSAMQLPGVRGNLNIICFLECEKKHIIKDRTLEVGYPPDKPSNISCSLGELSSEMICSWDSGQKTKLTTSYDVHVVNLQTGESYTEEKEEKSPIEVTVNRTQDEMFQIQITARNQLDYSASDVVLIHLSHIVIPIIPVIGEIRLLQSTFNISIRWRSQSSERQNFCEVQYKTLKDPSWRTIGKTVNINNSIVINKTQTADSLRVRCREETGERHWSNWSAPLQVPPSAPAGAPIVWWILGPEYNNGTREVTILITADNDEIPRRTISGYKVFYLDKGNMTTLGTCGASEVECVTLVPKKAKTVFVSAFNSYGMSPKSDVFTQEDSALPQPRNLISSSWPIQVQWQSPHSSGQPLLWYVLQWNPDTCDGKHRNVSWRKLQKDTTQFSLNDTISAEQRVTVLLYAVYSSGVSQPSKVEFKPESGPDSITKEKVSPNTLLIQWSEVPVCKRRGFITTYTLNVTELSSRVPYTYHSEARSFTLKEYHPDRRYSVCISASTKAGEGPDSCVFIEPDINVQNYLGPVLGTCLGTITMTTFILALLMIQKRIKSTLRLLLPKYLHDEYPNVRNSVAVKFLQEKQEDLGSFLNPSYSEPEITDLQFTYAMIIGETPEAHPLLKAPSDDNKVKHTAEVGPSSHIMTEHMSGYHPTHENIMAYKVKVGPPLGATTDNMAEDMCGYRPTDGNMVEDMTKVGPHLSATTEHTCGHRPMDGNMVEDMTKVDPHLLATTEHSCGYRPTDGNMVEYKAKVGQSIQTTTDDMTEHMYGYRPTDGNMVAHMAKVGQPIQTTTDDMTEHMSGYRPQASRLNVQSQDSYCGPSHLLDMHRGPFRLESPLDGSNGNDTFQMNFSLFQGMGLQVLNDGAPEDDSPSLEVTTTMTEWSEHQKCSEITEMAKFLSGQLICHLSPDDRELKTTHPYFPQIFARGT
ncbi:interleukin-12 receptor subunit beta-2-like [Mantella aurantiaca]